MAGEEGLAGLPICSPRSIPTLVASSGRVCPVPASHFAALSVYKNQSTEAEAQARPRIISWAVWPSFSATGCDPAPRHVASPLWVLPPSICKVVIQLSSGWWFHFFCIVDPCALFSCPRERTFPSSPLSLGSGHRHLIWSWEASPSTLIFWK